MAKIKIFFEGLELREIQLKQGRTTFGRRPFNDVVMDHLTVSGEHGFFQSTDNEVFVEDKKSTNGTYVNGKLVKRKLLHTADIIDIGSYKIQYFADVELAPIDISNELMNSKHFEAKSALLEPGTALAAVDADPVTSRAFVKLLTGNLAGKEIELVKVVTTIGKHGSSVVAITRRPNGFVASPVEFQGDQSIQLNGVSITTTGTNLMHGDVLELTDISMQFIQQPG